jgi:transcriptional regulator with XRE-family HTH domain
MTVTEMRPDQGVWRRRELSSFLRSRRERVSPGQVGLAPGGRRRTPGLRREEVAQLAGVGVTGYTWLEQGRDINASEQVLNAIARTLMLDRDEREHLFTLAGHANSASDCENLEVAESLRNLLTQVEPFPACIQSAKYDLIAYNRIYGNLIVELDTLPASERNCMWLTFANPVWREAVPDWETAAARMVAQLRAQMAEHAGEPAWKAHVKRLKAASPDFVHMWDQHEVALAPSTPRKQFRNPVVGLIRFDVVSSWLTPRAGARMLVYTPADAQSRNRLDELAEAITRPAIA